LTIEQQKQETARKEKGGKVDLYTVNPGHCKTAFNGWRGTKDPLDGAEVLVRLVIAQRGTWGAGKLFGV
jgi:hypothetical protein